MPAPSHEPPSSSYCRPALAAKPENPVPRTQYATVWLKDYSTWCRKAEPVPISKQARRVSRLIQMLGDGDMWSKSGQSLTWTRCSYANQRGVHTLCSPNGRLSHNLHIPGAWWTPRLRPKSTLFTRCPPDFVDYVTMRKAVDDESTTRLRRAPRFEAAQISWSCSGEPGFPNLAGPLETSLGSSAVCLSNRRGHRHSAVTREATSTSIRASAPTSYSGAGCRTSSRAGMALLGRIPSEDYSRHAAGD